MLCPLGSNDFAPEPADRAAEGKSAGCEHQCQRQAAQDNHAHHKDGKVQVIEWLSAPEPLVEQVRIANAADHQESDAHCCKWQNVQNALIQKLEKCGVRRGVIEQMLAEQHQRRNHSRCGR